MDKSINILVVEDEAIIAKDIRDQLLNLGYQVCGTASTAEEAIRKAAEMQPHLILMDIQIKGDRDGITAASEIIAQQDVPITFLTAHADEHTLQRAKRVGPYGYILKPFEEASLHTAIQVSLAIHELTLELKEANQELDTFNYSVAHDLRGPLRHIIAYTSEIEQLLKEAKYDEIQDEIDHLYKSSKRAFNLIESLLNLAHTSKKEIESENVALQSLAEEITTQLKQDPKYAHFDFRLSEMPEVQGDRVLLNQVLTNLIENAVKYSQHMNSPRVEIGSRRNANGETVYFVSDNGVGFDMQHVSKLFQPFARLHSDPKFESHGIGLNIVKRIIKRHHGRIWADAAVDQGATFHFTLWSQ